MPTIALVIGAAVWLAIAIALVVWFAVTTVAGPRRLPGIVDVLRWFLLSWPGRLAALAGWAVAGYHVFCQRP